MNHKSFKNTILSLVGFCIGLLVLTYLGVISAHGQEVEKDSPILPATGIGIEYETIIPPSDFLVIEVLDVLCGGPAQKGGIRKGDTIIAVNEETTRLRATFANMTKVHILLGSFQKKPVGTPFKIKVGRKDAPAGFTETTVFSEVLFYGNDDC